jgi:hypothetical protein
MMLTSDFVSFVSCLDACLDAVGVRPPLDGAVAVISYPQARPLFNYTKIQSLGHAKRTAMAVMFQVYVLVSIEFESRPGYQLS